ncbi:ABC transporter substrate-binding protein [Acidihalobacter ferrooxydans]|uniref:Iron ABC transporter substrate-binding protein n=1 Tax=Acidihalobacter ferrooxydans TaxID=1765967 RepID=A0A1P8UHI7_9GAMM|nr:extracellular solute-binding protein [Acidihalobacter ferrooxydans]APZ43290.1 iron ABC transporter substrate-binding protein [Acidihalobacter ferrooxydans]
MDDRNNKASRRQFLKLSAGAVGAGVASVFLPGLAGTAAAATHPMDKMLIAAAKQEGRLNVIALPPDWANYGKMIKTFEQLYGIRVHSASPDASSAQELQAIRSLKGQGRAPDAVDVGPSFALIGAKEGLFQPYKVSTWDSIPSGMKDPGGLWYGDYYGVESFGVNRSVVKNAPKTWADLLKPEYKGMVALNGSPLGAGAAFGAVYAAALANGGSLDDIGPGIEFFAKLAKAGNFNPSSAKSASLVSGQTPIVVNWDYLNLALTVKNKHLVQIDTILPEGAPPYGSYYCQAISQYAPNLKAAQLWEEFLYSDAGQLIYLEGYAHPARFSDMVSRGVVPEKLLKELPPAKPYKEVQFPTQAQSEKAQKMLQAEWTKAVSV